MSMYEWILDNLIIITFHLIVNTRMLNYRSTVFGLQN